ncbi:MAG: GNAT family protein [Actinomycetota bacterium]
MFKAIYYDSITLHLITEGNFAKVRTMFKGFPESDYMLAELDASYRPKFEDGKCVRYSFYVMLGNDLAGLTLLDIDDWETRAGSTGADMLVEMRGKGVAPRSKPHLFYLAFEILGLNRVATGCFVSNLSSKKSIEKTVGFQFEGTMRQSGLNDDGELEDEHLYAILHEDWLKYYNQNRIEVIY